MLYFADNALTPIPPMTSSPRPARPAGAGSRACRGDVAALAAALVRAAPRWRRCCCSAASPSRRPPARSSGPRSSRLADPYALAGMDGRGGGDRRRRPRGDADPGPRRLRRRRSVRHGAADPRAPRGRRHGGPLRAPPAARRLRLRAGGPRRCPGGGRRADPDLRLRHHRGRDGAGRARGRARGRGHRPPPARRRSCRRPPRWWIPSATTTAPAYQMLCGTGVAFKLVQALVPGARPAGQSAVPLPRLVALATVADVVPLTRREPHPRPARTPGAGRGAAGPASGR